jgi:MFS family permease
VLREEPNVRVFLLANAAWEGTFAAMSAFVILYITQGLDQPYLRRRGGARHRRDRIRLAAILSGPVGDRFGLARVILFASFVYGGGLVVAGIARTWHDYYYALIFPSAVAGGTVMTLSWGLLFKLMPARHRGAISGLATTTKGIGLLFGPLIAGAAIDLLAPYLKTTDGYQILWPLCGAPILAVTPLVASLLRVEPSGRPEPQLG